jgi:hypothetical protein
VKPLGGVRSLDKKTDELSQKKREKTDELSLGKKTKAEITDPKSRMQETWQNFR